MSSYIVETRAYATNQPEVESWFARRTPVDSHFQLLGMLTNHVSRILCLLAAPQQVVKPYTIISVTASTNDGQTVAKAEITANQWLRILKLVNSFNVTLIGVDDDRYAYSPTFNIVNKQLELVLELCDYTTHVPAGEVHIRVGDNGFDVDCQRIIEPAVLFRKQSALTVENIAIDNVKSFFPHNDTLCPQGFQPDIAVKNQKTPYDYQSFYRRFNISSEIDLDTVYGEDTALSDFYQNISCDYRSGEKSEEGAE